MNVSTETNAMKLDPILSLALHGAFINAESGELGKTAEWFSMADRRLVSLYGDLGNVPNLVWQTAHDILIEDYPYLAHSRASRVLQEWATS